MASHYQEALDGLVVAEGLHFAEARRLFAAAYVGLVDCLLGLLLALEQQLVPERAWQEIVAAVYSEATSASVAAGNASY